MKKETLGMLLMSLILVACAKNLPLEKSAPLEISNKATYATEKKAWEAEWDKTIMGAKKEARLTIYISSSLGSDARLIVSNEIKNKYGISLELIAGSGLGMSAKIIREMRAGIYAADLMISGATTMITVQKPAGIVDYIEPELILPEVKDSAVWFEGKLPFVDKDKQILNIINYPGGGALGINTDLVIKNEIKSATDLLNLKWKEKIVISDPTISGSGATMLMVIGEGPLGYDYIRKLVEQKPMIIRDERLMSEWVAQGKYAIAIGAGDNMREFKRAGLPVDFMVLPEARFLSEGGNSLVIYKHSPHQNARRIFINWLLSREGSTLWSRVTFKQSSRIDVPIDHLPPGSTREPGVNYFVLTEEYKQGEGQRIEKMKEIFKGLLP